MTDQYTTYSVLLLVANAQRINVFMYIVAS